MLEVKSADDDAWLTVGSDQVSKYRSKYRLVLVTKTRDFVLLGEDSAGQPTKLETFRIAESATEFESRLQAPRAFANKVGAALGEYLSRALSHRATLVEPKDLAQLLASYARDGLGRVEAAGDAPSLSVVRSALEEALGVRFEGQRGAAFFRSTLCRLFSTVSWLVLQNKARPHLSPPSLISDIGDLNQMNSGVYCIPALLREEGLGINEGELKSRPNLSIAAQTYLDVLGKSETDLFYHVLAVLHRPAFQEANAGALRAEGPRIPLPGWPEGESPGAAEELAASAARGRELAQLLDSDTPVPGVTTGTLRPEIGTIGVPATVGGHNMSGEDFSVTAGWGHFGTGDAVMPGQGGVEERPYTATESAAFGNLIGILGKTTFDIYLKGHAYWRSVPAAVWSYKLGGYQGEFDYELVDEVTGELLATLDLAWPDGLQVGYSQPAALLIDEDQDTKRIASQAGFRFYTDVESLRRYVREGILNQSQSGIYMDGGINTGLSGSEELFCPSLQDSPAPLLDLFPPRGQLGEEVTQFFLHRGSGAQAQVRGGLFPCPVPDRLGSIEIRTVSRQAHQSQAQAGGSQVGTQGVTMMDWSVVPDDVQWSGVLIPQLLQEGSGGLGVAVPLQFHDLHLAGLQAHRRIIAGLFAPPGAGRAYQRRLSLEHPFPPQVRIGSEMGLISEEDLCPHLLCLGQQRGIRRHEGFPFDFVGLKKMLLRPLQDKTQAVEVVQATAAGQRAPEAFLDKSPHHFPVPIRQVDACLFGQRLDRSLHLGLLVSVEGGGEPPDCSKSRAAAPPLPKAVTHMPMVWESRSSASATADAVQPWAKSQRACHRSRSRGVGDRYMRLRTSPTSSCHRSRSCTMSLIPTTTTRLPLQTNPTPLRV